MISRAAHRRITTWLAIVGYSLVASGLPLPVGSHEPTASSRHDAAAKRLSAKDRSRPFPCMDKPCGCATAEQCYTSCCCSTPAERLAWGRVHGVEADVLAALQRRLATDKPAREATGDVIAADRSCCGTKPARSRCDADAAAPSCCAADAKTAGCAVPQDDPDREPLEPPAAGGRVVLSAMLACGGIVSQWSAVGASLPPPRVEAVVGRESGDRVVILDEAAASMAAVPAAPPPRAA
jgi:hypothetical protein